MPTLRGDLQQDGRLARLLADGDAQLLLFLRERERQAQDDLIEGRIQQQDLRLGGGRLERQDKVYLAGQETCRNQKIDLHGGNVQKRRKDSAHCNLHAAKGNRQRAGGDTVERNLGGRERESLAID